MPGLSSFLAGHPFFDDTDGDGYPDRIALRISVHPWLEDPFVWAGLLNLTARLAFEVVALRPPILQRGAHPAHQGPQLIVYPPGCPAPGSERGSLPPLGSHGVGPMLHLFGASGMAMMGRLNAFAMELVPSQRGRRRARALGFPAEPIFKPLDLLDLSCLYDTSPSQPRLRNLKALFSLPQKRLTNAVGFALSDFVARLTLEATELSLPLAFVGKPARQKGIVFKVNEDKTGTSEIRVLGKTHRGLQTILLQGDPPFLAKSIGSWASWALRSGGEGCEEPDLLRERVESFRLLLAGAGYWGKWGRFLLRRPIMDSTPALPASGKTYGALAKACRALSLPVPPREKPPKSMRLSARWPSETEEAVDWIKRIPRGHGPVEGMVFLSKPKAGRLKLKARLEKILKARGYKPTLRVLNAYKPGLSWLLEEVLPLLKAEGCIASLEVLYQPFRSMDHALEMRSRWLQEMFPGPDILGLALAVAPHKIKTLCRPGLKATYEVRAFDAQGRLRLKERLSPPISRFPYLPRHPELGFVHPSTGGILLTQEGRTLLDKPVPTDRERFWQILQTRWLPLIEASMAERLKREAPDGQSAFWEDISVQVSIEETDLRLPLGEERICPMEALHEDVYFVLLQFFSSFAQRHGLGTSLQLGRVVPRVKTLLAGGYPSAEFRAKPLPWFQAPDEKPKKHGPAPFVSAASMAGGQWRFELHGPDTGVQAERFIALARAWGYRVTPGQDSALLLWTKAPAILQKASRPKRVHEPAGDRLLKAREVAGWIRRLSRSPHLGAWCASRSLQGRPIYALEAFSAGGDPLLPSIAKLRLLKPTLFFNARHHANEISSTNAALRMAWRLAATDPGRDMLRHVNVVWIPMENVDGVATFEQLLPTGKDHILHAARYNALGTEFYGDYFKAPPRFPEAKAKVRLWHRWLPEIMVDHHGVPSHEWNQPFSGYAPYGFREFWIPRNFVYACIPFVNEPRHTLHKSALEVSALLEKAMSELPEIVRLNKELASRYSRYARQPEPETFPASKGETLLVLPPLGRTYQTNFAVRYPRVTRSEIILEVPDEVASGKHLELCVLAHFKAEEALLGAFRRTKGRIEAALDGKTGLLRLAWVPGMPVLERQ